MGEGKRRKLAPLGRTVTRPTPVERCAHAFEQYLLDVRALACPTISNHLPVVHSFLDDRFGHGPVNLSRLRAGDVVRFLYSTKPRGCSASERSL